jgi:hypothetical protein
MPRIWISAIYISILISFSSDGKEICEITRELKQVFENPIDRALANIVVERLDHLDVSTSKKLFKMVEDTYRDGGLPLQKSEHLNQNNIFFVYRNTESHEPIAFASFYDTPYGIKSSLTANDGTALGRTAARELMKERFQVEGVYSELSKKSANFALKTDLGIPIVNFQNSEKILYPSPIRRLTQAEKKLAVIEKILPDRTEVLDQAYVRQIPTDGKIKNEMKVMVGKPLAASNLAKFSPLNDSAVEQETFLNEKTIKLFTTTDGTLGPLLEDRPIPPNLKAWGYKQSRFTEFQMKAIKWNKLPYDLQIEVLRTNAQGANFSTNRTIRGIIPRSMVTLTFEKETNFLGVRYPPGIHEVNLRGFLGNKVEYGSPESVGAVDWIEFHTRNHTAAGDLSNDSWTLFDGIQNPRAHQHTHIVGELPKKLVHSIDDETLLHTEYVRRTNALAEMSWIVHDRKPLNQKVIGRTIFYAPLKRDGLDRVTNYFQATLSGADGPLPQQKIAWAGFRGSQTYDQKGLWGIEFRAISPTSDPKRVRGLLNAVQTGMHMPDHGLKLRDLKKWTSDINADTPSAAMNKAWWHPGQKESAIPLAITQKYSSTQLTTLERLGHNNLEVNYLYHDWANDPYFYDSPTKVNQIRQLQEQSIQKLLSTEDPTNVVAEFLIHSGILEQYEKGFPGLN